MFNWFRRNKDNSQEQVKQDVTPTPETQEEAVEEKVDAPDEQYLEWAKTAFNNIQKQKAGVEKRS